MKIRNLLPFILLVTLGCSNASAPQEYSIRSLLHFSYKASHPSHDSLFPVFPNPFNRSAGDSSIVVNFDLDSGATEIHLLVQNALGDEVTGFVDSALAPGRYTGQWNPIASDGAPLMSGIYFVTFRTQNYIDSRLVNIQQNE